MKKLFQISALILMSASAYADFPEFPHITNDAVQAQAEIRAENSIITGDVFSFKTDTFTNKIEGVMYRDYLGLRESLEKPVEIKRVADTGFAIQLLKLADREDQYLVKYSFKSEPVMKEIGSDNGVTYHKITDQYMHQGYTVIDIEKGKRGCISNNVSRKERVSKLEICISIM